MIFRKKETPEVEKFWEDYEKSIGEKVLAKSLARYLSGITGLNYPLWGLAIATSRGFRFHHFAHEGWFMALSRTAMGGEAPKEKTFFIPKDKIISADLLMEKRWWKIIFSPAHPMLVIHCYVNDAETRVIIETDKTAATVADALKADVPAES